jgi:hypothetical protein
MPYMGPSDRQDDADKAFVEISELLQKKYGVSDIRLNEDFGFFKKDFNYSRIKLRDALREVFQWDSFNGF